MKLYFAGPLFTTPERAWNAEVTAALRAAWYTFQHTFKNVSGQLTVEMSVINAGGIVLETWTLSPSGDFIGQTTGGNRYAWLATNDFETLALDNVTRVTN